MSEKPKSNRDFRSFPACRIVGVLAACLVLVALFPAAAEDVETGWSDVAELSLVFTDGNSETTTLGFKNTAKRTWLRSSFTLDAGGIRAKSTTIDSTAVGTATNFRILETETDETTAEAYYLEGRYDRKISDTFFWFTGAGWDRNRPSGINNRYTAFGGVGNIWRDDDDVKFRTDYAATYTDQEDVVENPDVDDSFFGARFSWAYTNKIGQSSTYGNDLVVDLNADETDDYRADMVNWLQVAMSERMALKVGLRWLYDNQPSLAAIDLFANDGDATGSTVLVELDELDTIFTASLVVNF